MLAVSNIGEIKAFFASTSGMNPSMSDNGCYVNWENSGKIPQIRPANHSWMHLKWKHTERKQKIGRALPESGLPPPAAGRSALAFSTYFGGGKENWREQTNGAGIAVDKQGYVYITGRTQARDFPSVNLAQKKAQRWWK
jgi:hypothetical protein